MVDHQNGNSASRCFEPEPELFPQCCVHRGTSIVIRSVFRVPRKVYVPDSVQSRLIDERAVQPTIERDNQLRDSNSGAIDLTSPPEVSSAEIRRPLTRYDRRIAGAGNNTASFLRLLELDPTLCDHQCIHGQFLCDLVVIQFEPIRKEPLKHCHQLILRGIPFALCYDVVFLGIGPTRNSRDLGFFQPVRRREKKFERDVLARKSTAWGKTPSATNVRRLVGPDRRDLESRRRRLHLRVALMGIQNTV